MNPPSFATALQRWLYGLGGQPATDLPDDQLLQRFVRAHDESAFALLVQRHGPLVLGTCRRLLRDSHDAEDAFQATFLVLACRAAAIRRSAALSGFLYSTAYRIACRLRGQKTRHQTAQKQAARERPEAVFPPEDESETYALLHEELNRLPSKYRDALILCYLQGKTQEEAASELGHPLGSMSRHLSRARELLRERLLARGVAAVLGATLAEHAKAAVSSALLCGTLETIRRYALASALLAGSTPPVAVILAQGILRTAWITRLTLASLLLAVGAVFAGGVAALQTPADKQLPAKAETTAAPPEGNRQGPQPRRDLYGDPLPNGLLARMGTERLRHPLGIRLHFEADGKTLISVGQDQAVRFWDLKSGKLQRLQRLPSSQKVMTLSADGKMVALISEEHLHLWEIAAAKEIRHILVGKLADEKRLNCVEFSPDGRMLAAGNGDSEVFLWDVTNGKAGARFRHKDSRVQNLAFSPDGKILASIGLQHIILWDVAGRKELRTIKGGNSFYSRLAFSPDGKLLVESSVGSIRFWDVATGKKLPDLEFANSDKDENPLNCNFAFSPDGKTMAAGPGDYVALYDQATHKEVKRLEVNSSGIWLGSVWLEFSPDCKRLASLTCGKITLWDIASGKPLQVRPSHFCTTDSVAISPDGNYVASASGGDRTVRLWDAHNGKPLHVWPTPHRRIYPVLFTPDSAHVIAAGFEDCRMWDVAGGEERHIFRFPDVSKDASEMLSGLHLSPDGRRLTALSLRSHTKDKRRVFKRYLTTWDVAGGQRIQRRLLSFDDRITTSLEQLSPDGKYAPIFTQKGVMIYDVVADRPLRYLTGTWGDPEAFSPDGKLLAYSEGGPGPKLERLRIHELTSGTDVLTLDAGPVFRRDFTPDSRYLLTDGEGGLRLWELASGKQVLRYQDDALASPSFTYLVRFLDSCLVIAADGRSAAVGAADTNILVWDIAPATRQKGKLSAADLNRLWSDLAEDDAPRAYRAIGTLSADPQRAVPFLRERLQPVKEDAPRIRQLIAELDSDQFAVRDAAYKELEKMDEAAHAILRQALPKTASLELRRRIESLLSVPWVVRSPEKLRQIRAVTALEQIGDAEARRVLERLADGAAEARQTREAKAALQRLKSVSALR